MTNKEYEFEPGDKEDTNSFKNINVTTCIITTHTVVCILFSATAIQCIWVQRWTTVDKVGNE